MLLGKDLNNQIAFSFLLDIKNSFIKTYSHDKIYDSFAFQLNSFETNILKLIDKYTKSLSNQDKMKMNLIDETKILNQTASLLKGKSQKCQTVFAKANCMKDLSSEICEYVF